MPEPTNQEKTAQLVKQAVEEAILPLRQEIAGIKTSRDSLKMSEPSLPVDFAALLDEKLKLLHAQLSQKPQVVSAELLMNDPMYQEARVALRGRFLQDLQERLSPFLVQAIAYELDGQAQAKAQAKS